MYYRSNMTGLIFGEVSASILKDIFGIDEFENEMAVGNIEPIDPPDVITLLRQGDRATAIHRYREIHPGTSLREARKMVNRIEKDMARIRAKHIEKQ